MPKALYSVPSTCPGLIWPLAPTRCWSSTPPVEPERDGWSRPTLGSRSTDRPDLPEHKAGYALCYLTRLVGDCAGHHTNIGIYAERLLDDPLPWTRMRSVYPLLAVVRRYGPDPVEAAWCGSLDLDVVTVSKIAATLANATERDQPVLPAQPVHPADGSPATPVNPPHAPGGAGRVLHGKPHHLQPANPMAGGDRRRLSTMIGP